MAALEFGNRESAALAVIEMVYVRNWRDWLQWACRKAIKELCSILSEAQGSTMQCVSIELIMSEMVSSAHYVVHALLVTSNK